MLKLIAGALLLAVTLKAQTAPKLGGSLCPNGAGALIFQTTAAGVKGVAACVELGNGLSIVDGKLSVQFPAVQVAMYSRVDRFKLSDFGPFPATGAKSVTFKLKAPPIPGSALLAAFIGSSFTPLDIVQSDGTVNVVTDVDAQDGLESTLVVLYWSAVPPSLLP